MGFFLLSEEHGYSKIRRCLHFKAVPDCENSGKKVASPFWQIVVSSLYCVSVLVSVVFGLVRPRRGDAGVPL